MLYDADVKKLEGLKAELEDKKVPNKYEGGKIRPPESSPVTLRQLSSFPKCKRQRDTERHGKKILPYLLKNPSSDHTVFSTATWPGGSCMLDGHTRIDLMERGLLPIFPEMQRQNYKCKNEEEALELYTHFNSQESVENVKDQITGARRQIGLDAQSDYLRRDGYNLALTVAYYAIEGVKARKTYDLHAYFAEEIELIDRINPPRDFMCPGVGAAMLVTFKKLGVVAYRFWSDCCEQLGTKGNGQTSPTLKLFELVKDLKFKGKMRGEGNATVFLRLALRIFEKWMSKGMYKTRKCGIVPLDDYDMLVNWAEPCGGGNIEERLRSASQRRKRC
jgi:hypothetical protein